MDLDLDWDQWCEAGNGDDGATPPRPALGPLAAYGTSYSRGLL